MFVTTPIDRCKDTILLTNLFCRLYKFMNNLFNISFKSKFHKVGTVNVQNLLSRANSCFSPDLLKNIKVFPRAARGIDFLPGDLRLETSITRILEARGRETALLIFNFYRSVILTPVRSNGGQVYNFGHFYLKTPVSL